MLDLIAACKRALWVSSPFLAAVVLLVAIGGISIDMLSAARAYVGGESLWADGRKEAAYALDRFVRTRDEADFRDFRRHIAVPLGDRAARLELNRADPDLALVRQGFIEGGNHPDDIAGMIRLYRRFDKLSYMAQAIDIWTRADVLVVELAGIADQLHRHIASNDPDAQALQQLVERADAIGRQLSPLERSFSATISEAARRAEVQLQLAMLALACALMALAVALSQRMSRRVDQAEAALRRGEERLRLAANGSNDGLWDWDLLSGSLYCSPRVNELMGCGPDDLSPHADALFQFLHPDDAPAARAAMHAHLHDRTPYEVELRLRSGTGEYRWFLMRGQSVRNAKGRAVRMAGSIRNITDRRRDEAAIKRHAMQQGLIAAYGQLALGNPEIDELMSQAVVVVNQGLDVEFCRLLAAGSDDQVLTLKAGSGWNAEWMQRLSYDAAEETKNRFIIGARESIIVDDYRREARLKPSAVLRAHDVLSAAELLICGSHGSYGILGIYAREVGRFTQESVNFLRSITNTIASAMDRKVADERLTYMAQFDPLTNLPNRSLYLDRLWQTITRAGRDGSAVGVLFIDLDRFKIVNDTLGHSAGDALLVQVAQRLEACVRPGDTVGRLGGDEFAVALSHLARAEDASPVAQEIVEAMSLPFEVSGQEVYVSASIGISIFPSDGTEPDQLLKNADTAMYRAKEAGSNTHQFYLAEMNERAVERLKLETQLRGALDRGEFLLHYQPKVHLSSGKICGFEALLRWQHPARGLVPPAVFISILEDTGLIIPVGEWVVVEVCAQLNRWRDAGLALLPVAINLSARQFNQKNLDAVVGSILRKAGIGPGLLEFELTESMLMRDPEAAVQTMKSIKAYGIRLSVDDFGTGYSSLAYLKRFPLDALKIDRAFIRDVTTDPDDATIAIAIINLARNLKLNVVAEGVETEAQLDFLRAHDCAEIQGYYFARPLPAATCTQALAEGWCLATNSSAAEQSDEPSEAMA